MPPNDLKQHNWCHNMLWLVTVFFIAGECFVNGDSSIPHPCDNVKCPPLEDLTCPEDSSIREILAEPLIAVDDDIGKHIDSNLTNSVEMTEEIFSQCCLNQKCICNLCRIRDCHNEGEVVVELLPESIDMPGYCCGKYDCQTEPNCTEVLDTESYWLTNCQRCKCYKGQRLCHQSCDTGIKKPAICHSKSLNTFFEHGQSWRDGCSDCECVNGEVRCMITFCKGLDCPKQRQVQLKGSCCPVCWPKGYPIPRDTNDYDEENEFEDHNDIDVDYNDNEEEPDLVLKPISDDYNSNATTTMNNTKPIQTSIKLETTTKESLFTTTTIATSLQPCKVDNTIANNGSVITSTATTTSTITVEPCSRQEVPATYQVYPQVVELMRYSQHNNLLYTIIGCLSVLVVVLAAWSIHLKAKQRSYRPVSNFDDNFNRMSSNIKKMNDYV